MRTPFDGRYEAYRSDEEMASPQQADAMFLSRVTRTRTGSFTCLAPITQMALEGAAAEGRFSQDGAPDDPAHHGGLKRHIPVTIATRRGPCRNSPPSPWSIGTAATTRSARSAERKCQSSACSNRANPERWLGRGAELRRRCRPPRSVLPAVRQRGHRTLCRVGSPS